MVGALADSGGTSAPFTLADVPDGFAQNPAVTISSEANAHT